MIAFILAHMCADRSVQNIIEDHALERVPDGDRRGWLAISWNTVGIATTLVQLYVGALVAFVAGIKIALVAGIVVAILGGFLGWGVGHAAFRSGLASGVLARVYGFGIKGSLLISATFGFMLIGFLAAENVLLYKGFLFYFDIQDSLTNQILIYGVLMVAWILLTVYGFALVTRVSTVMLNGFMIVLVYMMIVIVDQSGKEWLAVASFPSQYSPAMLGSMGIESDWDKFVFCINVMAGATGALALLDADLGRYADRSKDIAIAAFLGNIALDVITIWMGAVIMYAGLPALVDYYVAVEGLSDEQAVNIAARSPDRVAAAFIIFGGWLGTVLMLAAQSKAQVLNSYSGSLSLSNFFDGAFSWRPGRLAFVVLANVLSLCFLYGGILEWYDSFLIVLGILTMSFAGVIVADCYIVKPRLGHHDVAMHGADVINWAGVIAVAMAFVSARYIFDDIVPIEILTALAVSLVVYPLLRSILFRPVAGS